ncbi:MAG: KGG domain-containing protein [Dongiaceae bacterium]
MADTAERQNRPAGTSQRGFAAMDPQKQREIARKGGESVPPEKRSFSQDRRLAAAAGRTGGRNRHAGNGRTRQAAEQPGEETAGTDHIPGGSGEHQHHDSRA